MIPERKTAASREAAVSSISPGPAHCRPASQWSGRLKVRCRRLAALADDLEAQLLALRKVGHARALDGADMHEDVGRAVVRLDESEALLGVEPFNSTDSHGGLQKHRLIAPRDVFAQRLRLAASWIPCRNAPLGDRSARCRSRKSLSPSDGAGSSRLQAAAERCSPLPSVKCRLFEPRATSRSPMRAREAVLIARYRSAAHNIALTQPSRKSTDD